MSDKIVLYKTFYNPIEASIVRAKLEDSGYHCFLTNENLLILNPLYNQAMGGVRLHVFESDLSEIDLLMSEGNDLAIADSSESEDKKTNDKEIICEKCGSKNVGFGQATKRRFSWWVALISILLSMYPFKVNKCFHCYDCGHEFK